MFQIKHIQNHIDKRSHSTIVTVHNIHAEGYLLFNKLGPTYQYTIKHLYFPKHINHYIGEAACPGPNPLGKAQGYLAMGITIYENIPGVPLCW